MTKEEEILLKIKPGCLCKGVRLHKIIKAIEEGARSYEEIARKTGIGGGSCDSKRCGEKVADLLREINSKDA